MTFIDVDNLGVGRAPLCFPVIISHLFTEVGPCHLSNLRRRRRHHHQWALRQSSGLDGWLVASWRAHRYIASRRVDASNIIPPSRALYKPDRGGSGIPSISHMQRGGDGRSLLIKLPKSVRPAGPNLNVRHKVD